MRRSYTQKHMTTATETKPLKPILGSNGVHTTQRRCEEIIEILPSISDCDKRAEANNMAVCVAFARAIRIL